MECITRCGGNKAQKWKGSRDSPEIEVNRTQSSLAIEQNRTPNCVGSIPEPIELSGTNRT